MVNIILICDQSNDDMIDIESETQDITEKKEKVYQLEISIEETSQSQLSTANISTTTVDIRSNNIPLRYDKVDRNTRPETICLNNRTNENTPSNVSETCTSMIRDLIHNELLPPTINLYPYSAIANC